MFRWIFVGVLLSVAWSVSVYFGLPLWMPAAVTGATLLIIGIVYAVRAIRLRRASREIERALKEQAEADARTARPDLEADIRSMQDQFAQAIDALKGTRLGARGASTALSALPWYVVVGPPGVGKSTVLRNSGLHFPFLSRRGTASVKGVGGTRNCDWWMTSEAILLDTAGRYSVGGEDAEEWFAFLDVLRKYRRRRPINGVLVAVSASEVADATPEERLVMVGEVRARIDELQARLGVVVPVYLLFTKCDLMPGFVEMFSDLDEEGRHQIWGFTLSAHGQASVGHQCGLEMEALTSLLEQRCLRRLGEERSVERRERLFGFPQSFETLKDPAHTFVAALAEPTIVHESPIVRGVYFTSGTQEGQPLGRIMNAVSETLGAGPAAGGTDDVGTEPRSYFLGDLFRKVVFRDHAIVRRNSERSRRGRLIGLAVGVLALLISVSLVALPFAAYRNNRELLGRGGTALAYVEAHLASDTVDIIPVEHLEPVRDLVELFLDHDADGVPTMLRMGMYQGRRALPGLRDVFAEVLRRELVVPVCEREFGSLAAFADAYAGNGDRPSSEEYDENFARLRMYLLLTGPQSASDQAARGSEAAWLTEHLAQLWEAPLRASGDRPSRAALQALARTYVRLVGAYPGFAFERDENLVTQARSVLLRVDRTETLTEHLIDAISGPALTLAEMIGDAPLRNDERRIRPAFTKKGFQTQVKPILDDGLASLLDPMWVLADAGEEPGALLKQELVAVRTAYYRAYIEEWRSFLDGIYVVTPKDKNIIDAIGLLSELVGDRPYEALMAHVTHHTLLFDPALLESDTPGPPKVDDAMDVLARGLRREGQMAVSRVGNRALSASGLTRYGLGTSVMMAAGRAALEERAAADPNDVEVLSEYTVYLHFKDLVDFGGPKKEPTVSAKGIQAPTRPRPLDEYQDALRALLNAMEARRDGRDVSEEELRERLESGEHTVNQLVARASQGGWGPMLEGLLLPPFKMADQTAASEIGRALKSKWCNEIVEAFDRTLRSRYPFDRRGPDVAMQDFLEFYHPQSGRLWAHYEAAMKSRVIRRGSKYTLAESGRENPYSASVVAFLNASRQVADSMVPRGREAAAVEFDVTVRGSSALKEITLVIDGTKVRYRNGPVERHTVTWPGEGTPGASLVVHGLSASSELKFPGEFGLFRLLEAGAVRRGPDGQRTFVAQWDFRDEDLGLVQITFEMKWVDTPFFGLGGRRPFLSVFRDRALMPPTAPVRGQGEKCK